MKKISVILAVLMLVSTLALSAFAADGASFTVSSGAGKPGDTVSVTVAIKNNPGIVGMQMDLTFDASVLTVVSCTSSDTRFLPVPFDAKNYENASKITLVRAVAPLGEIPIIKDDFTIATLGFKIADTAADGVYESRRRISAPTHMTLRQRTQSRHSPMWMSLQARLPLRYPKMGLRRCRSSWQAVLMQTTLPMCRRTHGSTPM